MWPLRANFIEGFILAHADIVSFTVDCQVSVSFRKFVLLLVLIPRSRKFSSKFDDFSFNSSVRAVVARCSPLDGIRTRTFANISLPRVASFLSDSLSGLRRWPPFTQTRWPVVFEEKSQLEQRVLFSETLRRRGRDKRRGWVPIKMRMNFPTLLYLLFSFCVRVYICVNRNDANFNGNWIGFVNALSEKTWIFYNFDY